jgi:hypothetical protein
LPTALRSRLTFANVTSVIALLVALGGASYAAVSLPKGSVGPRQLRKNAVTSTKVKPRSLLLSDFKASHRARLRGPRGLAGEAGPPGPAPICPEGTVSHELACIETAQRPQATWPAARETCRQAGRRLPSLSELTTFEQRTEQFVPTAGSEWVEGLSEGKGLALTMTQGTAFAGSGEFEFRCVARGSPG